MAFALVPFGAFCGAMAWRGYRNYMSDDNDVQYPSPGATRKQGVVDRILANPRLVEQYNEKYVAKKLAENSACQTGSNKIQMTRTMSLKRMAGTSEERAKQDKKLQSLAGA
jgi:hypothetical protein